MQKHPFPPVYDAQSEILILGSFPSVKSREQMFYYANPQNRFWKVLAAVYGQPVPETTEEKTAFLLSQHLAVWDVLASCEITASSDSTIKNPTPNDIGLILENSSVHSIFCNGSKAYEIFQKYIRVPEGVKTGRLPSTSPANARYRLERLCGSWRSVLLP